MMLGLPEVGGLEALIGHENVKDKLKVWRRVKY